MQNICLHMKDGKILIVKKNKSEPLHKDVVVINQEEEVFLIGPYPKQNTIIMPLNQYHKMLMELKNNCPNARSWRVIAIVFIGMFIVMVCIYFQQTILSQTIFKYRTTTYNDVKME